MKGNDDMSTQDCIKKYAVDLLASLSYEKMEKFIMLFADENTIARMESELIACEPNRKHYDNFDEILFEVKEEMKNEE